MTKKRPTIKGIVTETTLENEKFQNETIRPIIKMQHDFLIGLFQQHLSKRKTDFLTISKDQMLAKIKAIFEKDANFKHLILGVVIGQFSLKEFETYKENTTEFHKRIIQITVQRIHDTFIK